MSTSVLHVSYLKGYKLWLARVAWFGFVSMAICAFWISSRSRLNQLLFTSMPLSPILKHYGLHSDFFQGYLMAVDTLFFVVFASIALVIFLKRSTYWLAIFTSAMLFQMGVALTRPTNSLDFLDPAWRLFLLFAIATGSGMVIFFPYIFPQGRLTSKWMGALGIASMLWPFVWYLFPVLTSRWIPWPPEGQPILVATLWVGIAIFGLVYRYRKLSTPTQRAQIRWIVNGLVIAAAGFLGFLYFTPLLIPAVTELTSARFFYILIGVPALYLSASAIPISLAFSVLRHHLWDIDIVLNRTLVYVPLTGILAGLFAAIIKAIQSAFVALTGDQSDAALIMTTLILFAVFTPIKNLLQTIVDQNFKEKADPARKLKDFDQQLQSILRVIDPQQLTYELLDKAAASLSAKSGALMMQVNGDLKTVHIFGQWDGEEALSVPIQMEDRVLGRIILGPSLRSSGYQETDRQILEACAGRVAQALSVMSALRE